MNQWLRTKYEFHNKKNQVVTQSRKEPQVYVNVLKRKGRINQNFK